jgi:hypothetical protein
LHPKAKDVPQRPENPLLKAFIALRNAGRAFPLQVKRTREGALFGVPLIVSLKFQCFYVERLPVMVLTQISKPDLHVVSLRYTLQPEEGFSYENPPTREFETDEAHFRLAEGVLTCGMKMHFPDAASARKVIDPIVQAWEAFAVVDPQ